MFDKPQPGLQSEIDSRCPCFALPTSECQCQSVDPNYSQMIYAIQQANSWLSHAHQLMVSQGISCEEIEAQWPTFLADSLHYCGEVLNELDPE